MSLSKATSQAVPAKSGMLAPSKSHEPFAGSPPRLSPKPMASASANDIHTTPGEARQGRHSRSNSFHESQQIQLELKAGGELVFASDATGNAVLKGGTFQKLVEWILTSIGTDEKMVHNFIVSYRQWRPPMELWRILMEKFDGPNKTPERLEYYRKRVGQFVLSWVDLCVERDFFTRKARGRLFNKMLAFLPRLVAAGHQMLAYRIKIAVLRRRAAIIKLRADAKLSPKVAPKKVKSKLMTFTLFDHDMAQVAQQLALIESELFVSVSTRELFNLAWRGAKAKQASPNVGTLVERFNNVSYWVATEILLMAPGKRAPAIQQCIDLAAHCLEYGNYNSLMEILAGLNHVSVTRLKEEFNSLPPKHVQTLAELNATMDNQHNYRVYREQLQSRKPPCIPYLGVFLRDMTFLEEGNRQYADSKDQCLNFEKMQLIGDTLRDLIRMQRTCRYTFKKKEPLHKHLLACEFPMLDDENLYQQSASFRAVGAPL